MHLHPDTVRRFQEAWREERGEELTLEQAEHALRTLVEFHLLLQRRRRADGPDQDP